MKPRREKRDEFYVCGIFTTTTNKAETSPETSKIGPLWGRFFGDDILAKIPEKISGPVAVYTEYEGDQTAPYKLVVGARVDTTLLAELPAEMVLAHVPEQDYLVFEARGEMPNAIVQTWQAVWSYFDSNENSSRNYSSDFEEYLGDGSGADIFIGLTDRA